MDMISAAGAVAVIVGGIADGWIDTKYAVNPDNTPRTVMGMSPGIALGVGAAVVGAIGLSMGHKSFGGLLVAGGIGVLGAEGMRYSATKTAAAMQAAPAGTQGVLGYQAPHQLPAFAPSNANASRGGVTQWELDSVFGQLENIRRQRQAA